LQKEKQGLDSVMDEIGSMVAEAIMYIEREEIAGPDYRPLKPDIYKWARGAGSVRIRDEVVKVEHPRIRGRQERGFI